MFENFAPSIYVNFLHTIRGLNYYKKSPWPLIFFSFIFFYRLFVLFECLTKRHIYFFSFLQILGTFQWIAICNSLTLLYVCTTFLFGGIALTF